MRITGGALRSRRLVAPGGTTTRPTSDRVREALFSILASHVELREARVLDLYAGSGALAFEALSRGASHATLVEHARDAVSTIHANAKALGIANRTTLLAARVERALAQGATGSPSIALAPLFDLVLIDPPYADVTSGAVTRALTEGRLAARVALHGVVVLEHASRSDAPLLQGMSLLDTRHYGDSAIALFAREGASHHDGASYDETHDT
jgi:16S rRNA (guanine966-N2)-methyltransferase